MTTGDDSHISSTIIDGNKNGSVVSFVNNEDTSSVLTGFTIQNGSGTLIDAIESHGGGIYCKSASPFLKNLKIIDNSATHLGGGIYCSESANPIISDIIINRNKTLDETTGQGGGLFCWLSAPELNNVLMVNNSSIYGGGAYLGGEGTATSFNHVTIVDNIGTYGAGLYLNLDDGQFTDQPTVLNSIIWNNKSQQIYFSDNNPWGIDISYSIIEGGQESIINAKNATVNWGIGNITSSPVLTSNYRLDPYSPAIGAASTTGDLQTDLNGDPRPNPQGSLPDIGAYESTRALRLLRTSPILDGLVLDDISLWNDKTSLSAHWKKFENNSSINYEYAIGTYDVNNIADCQSSGSDTFITVTGLNLDHDSTYFFNIIGIDAMGRVSKTSTSNGVLIDIIPPSIISADKEWTALNPVLGDLKLQLNISEPVVAGLINLSSSQGDQYELEYNLIKKEKYEMTISGPFIGGDEISIEVTGLQDRAGTVASDTILTYPVGYLSDYNIDGLIDASDLSEFVTGWLSKDFQYELGPTVGKVPFLKPDVDGQFDIYDAAAFTRMWHWSLNKSGKMIPRYYVNSGKNLTSKNENQTLMINVFESVSTMYMFFEYPKDKVVIKQLPQSSSENKIFLSDLDTLNGELLITAGFLEPKLQSIEVPYIIKGKDDVSIKATYQTFNTSGEIESQGTKEITLKPVPKEFALHQNYPNPFNPITTINYDLPKQTDVNLIIYDIMGREVVKLIQEEMTAGYQSITWNARNSFGLQVSAGIYFYQIQTSDFVKTKKMIILK